MSFTQQDGLRFGFCNELKVAAVLEWFIGCDVSEYVGQDEIPGMQLLWVSVSSDIWFKLATVHQCALWSEILLQLSSGLSFVFSTGFYAVWALTSILVIAPYAEWKSFIKSNCLKTWNGLLSIFCNQKTIIYDHVFSCSSNGCKFPWNCRLLKLCWNSWDYLQSQIYSCFENKNL